MNLHDKDKVVTSQTQNQMIVYKHTFCWGVRSGRI